MRFAPLLAWAVPSWIFFVAGWPVGLAIWVTGLVRAFWRRDRGLATWLVFLGPLTVVPVLSFANGVVGYATGRAVLMTNGLMMGGPHLDRETRARWVSAGCVTDGSEVFWQTPNNLAVRGLVALFGTVPGAYDGFFPTREEAASTPITDDFEKTMSLGREIRAANHDLLANAELRFAWFGKCCIIVHVIRDGRLRDLVLVDVRTRKAFARYHAPSR